MKLRIVPARHGALWVRSGFRIFFRRPLAFGSLFAAFLFGITVLMLVPYIGVLLVLAALPLVTQAFMVGTRRALQDKPPMPDVFVEPLRAGRPQAIAMLQIGLVYALATVALMWAGGIVDGGKFAAFEDVVLSGNGTPAQAEALLADPQLTIGLLLRVGFAGLLSLPFWHAPPLVHWGAQGWAKSLFFSTVACWRNKAAFAVYALTWMAVLLAFGVFANVVFAALGQTRLIALAALPAGLMFSTVFYASLYFTFADCFEHRPEPGAADAPPRPEPVERRRRTSAAAGAHVMDDSTSRSDSGRRVAVVTGAGSGIGRATAVALAQAGWAVVLAGRRADALQASVESAAAAAITTTGPLLAVPTDCVDPAAVRALFDRVQAEFGRLDLLFNNAGTGAPAVPMDELTVEQWRSVVDINLTGVFLCTQQAFRLMKAQSPRGGRIINNGSISAHAPRPFSAPYTATKHAITGLTKATSLDGRAHDIACGQIDIGNAGTEMTERMTRGVPQANGEVKPEPRMDVAHVANAVVHMASLPLDANVQFMTVMATKMPFIGRG